MVTDSAPVRGPDEVLPLHLSLAGRRVVVVGGGPVAARKVAACLAAGADVLVVAPYACEQIVGDAAAGGLICWQRAGLPRRRSGRCLAGVRGDRGPGAPTEQVEAQATAQRIFCVRADDAAAGLGPQPGGGAPGRSGDQRRVRSPRRRTGRSAAGGRGPQRHRAGHGLRIAAAAPAPAGTRAGWCWSAAGPGDADLLTLRGRRELAAADVVVGRPAGAAGGAGRTGARGADPGRRQGARAGIRCRSTRSTGCWSSTRRPVAGWCGSRAATRSCWAGAARRSPPAGRRVCPVDVVPGRDQRVRGAGRGRYPGHPSRAVPAGDGAVRSRRGGRTRRRDQLAALAAGGGTLVVLMGVARAAGDHRRADRRPGWTRRPRSP